MERMSSSGSSRTERWSWVSVRSEEVRRELVLRLVWGAGDPMGLNPTGLDTSGAMVGRGFPPRRYTSLVKNVEVFSRYRSIILQRMVRHSRLDEVRGGESVVGAGIMDCNRVSRRSADCGTQISDTSILDRRSRSNPARSPGAPHRAG